MSHLPPAPPAPNYAPPMPTPAKAKKPWYKRWWVWVIAAVLFFSFVGALTGEDEKPSASATPTPTPEVAEPSAEPTEEDIEEEEPAEPEPTEEAVVEEATVVEEAAAEPETTEEEPAAEQPVAEEPAQPELTLAQQNAVNSANNYLSFMAFSRDGLIGQLEFDDYSTEDATFAVDHVAPDWNEQAAESAQNYLDFMSFSRQGLIDQLVFDGFTPEQADYGVTAVGY